MISNYSLKSEIIKYILNDARSYSILALLCVTVQGHKQE